MIVFLRQYQCIGPRYVCQLCGAAVSMYASSLYVHVKNHMNYKPYACSLCDYRTPVKSKARRHVQVSASIFQQRFTAFIECASWWHVGKGGGTIRAAGRHRAGDLTDEAHLLPGGSLPIVLSSSMVLSAGATAIVGDHLWQRGDCHMSHVLC